MTERSKAPDTEVQQELTEIDLSKLLADAWRGLTKFWGICLVIVLLAAIIAGVYGYFFYRPNYQVSASFVVRPQDEGMDSNIIIYQNMGDNLETVDAGETLKTTAYSNSVSYIGSATASALAEAFPYMLSTNVLQDKICEDLGITSVPVNVSAENLENTSMISLTATGKDPTMTYNVLMSVMENYPQIAKYAIGSTALIVIIPPEYPTEPANPNARAQIVLYGFLIGIVICLAWLLTYGLLRTTVRTRSDVKDKLGQHTVGVLPQVTFKKYTKEINQTILLTNPRIGDGFLEAMRLLRNSFLHRLYEKDRVVLLTSTAPGEGKSTVSVNLALSLADAGKKVLLIDGDIRNPSVAGILSMDIEFEEDSKTPFKLIHMEKGYDLLLFDPKNKRRWNVVQGRAFPSLLGELEKQYDLILIDTPPAGLLSDAQSIAQSADAVLYVVMEDTVRISRISKSIRDMLDTRVHFLGCVLNGVTSGITGYGENYGYTYGGYSRYKSYGRYARYGYDKSYEAAKPAGDSGKSKGKVGQNG